MNLKLVLILLLIPFLSMAATSEVVVLERSIVISTEVGQQAVVRVNNRETGDFFFETCEVLEDESLGTCKDRTPTLSMDLEVSFLKRLDYNLSVELSVDGIEALQIIYGAIFVGVVGHVTWRQFRGLRGIGKGPMSSLIKLGAAVFTGYKLIHLQVKKLVLEPYRNSIESLITRLEEQDTVLMSEGEFPGFFSLIVFTNIKEAIESAVIGSMNVGEVSL